jgi:hypothetical protein
VNDGNVANTSRTALKVVERQVHNFTNSPNRRIAEGSEGQESGRPIGANL